MIIRSGCLSFAVRVLLLSIVLSMPARAATFTVTNGTDVGYYGTLREAIQLANASGGKDTIDFQIPPVGTPATIQTTNSLPLITDPVIIDGWSQVGGPTCQAGIEIDGSLQPSGNGLWLSTTNCDIKGLCINRMPLNGILINQGGYHRIFGCFIGTDIAGTTDLGNGSDGIVIVSSVNNSIGLLPTYSCTNRNVISGNGLNGVEMMDIGLSCSDNILQNNHIGVDANGSAAIPNDRDGVKLDGAFVSGNYVGSTAAPKPVNVISGNRTNGVYIYQGSVNYVLGNHIGVNRRGDGPVGNMLNGVWITNASGCVVGDSGGEARNVISGNGDDGVEIAGTGTAGNSVYGNYIGVASNGLGAIPNGGHGILLTSWCTQNKVGDESSALGRNVISGNAECGVKIGESAFGNWVFRNYIGVSANGLIPVTNQHHGVLVENAAHGNYIGSGGTMDSGNVISGNGYTNTYHGVCIQNGAWGIEVDRNIIGLNAANFPAPNAGDGVHIENAHTNTIGTVSAFGGNVISGNGRDGVRIGPSSTRNYLYQNRIGLDTNGTSARANGGEGVHIYRASHNVISSNTGPRNVISGNAGSGVLIEDNALAYNNTVQNNYIGTDVSGGIGIGNSDHGVRVAGGVSNMIGNASAGNVISANDRTGVRLDSLASYNQVVKNLIGLDAAGATALGNQTNGVYISGSPRNIIGQVGGLGNVISGNGEDGIHILGANSVSNTIKANTIGMDISRVIPMGNTGHGVWIGTSASGNRIGGTNVTDLNLIGYNGDCGVRITSGTNNAILGNSIVSNLSLGIDLGTTTGVTLNDDQDPDTGANFLQNYPLLYEATTGSVIVAGLVNSRPSTIYWLEFFLSDEDSSGYGEGATPIAGTNITTDAGGNATFEFTLLYTARTGRYVTATATDPFGNTSEFAKNVLIVPNAQYGDADGDGMPTRWEGPNHLDPNDASGTNGAAGDPDGDDSSNFDEYIADTSPSDPSNYFHIVDVDAPKNVLVAYASTNTRYYFLSCSTNPLDGSGWTNVSALSVQGSNTVTTTDDARGVTNAVYRVIVQTVP